MYGYHRRQVIVAASEEPSASGYSSGQAFEARHQPRDKKHLKHISRKLALMPQQLQRVEEALHDRLTKRRVDGVYGIIKLVDERAAGAVQFVHGRG